MLQKTCKDLHYGANAIVGDGILIVAWTVFALAIDDKSQWITGKTAPDI
jgi:hypothetical protein